MIRGAAPEPISLILIDGDARLESATDLWGLGTGKTEEALLQRYSGAHIASIGIAGENQVQMSCVIHDRSRAAGRPGFGAVMGAKRLKAVVFRGIHDKPLDDPKGFAEQGRAFVSASYNDGTKLLGEYGTSRGLLGLCEMGIPPTKNFQSGFFASAEQISGQRMHDTILVGRETCRGCPVRCKRQVRTSFAGRDVVPAFGGPEYETLAAFGSLCLNQDLEAIALANQLCNDYGLDTISAGVAIGFLMEASERGLIDASIPWGDGGQIVSLVDQIARRSGVGALVGDGLESYARSLGSDFHMTIKGVELPMHEPRGKHGVAISYATSPRGATHLEGVHDTVFASDSFAPELELGVNKGMDPRTLDGKPAIVALFENLRSFDNSAILCFMVTGIPARAYVHPQIRGMLGAATGLDISAEEVIRIGERNYALLKIHAARSGYTHADDRLPERLFHPLPDGATAGEAIDEESLRTAIDEYYGIRGYDRYGPTDETLQRLGLDDLKDCIRRDARPEKKGAPQHDRRG